MTDLQELMALLETCRDYVAAALHEERQKFAGHEHCSDIPDMEADLAKIDAVIRSPAFAEMARDAERYRWLRDNGAGVLHVYAGTDEHSLLPDELDAAIDAQRHGRGKGSK